MYINILRRGTNGRKTYQGQIKVARLGEANAIKHAVDLWCDETMQKELYSGVVSLLPIHLGGGRFWSRNVSHARSIQIKRSENVTYQNRLNGDNVHPRDRERWQSFINDNMTDITIMEREIETGVHA